MLKACVAEVKKLGGEPFIIPAMGSHGGATAEGQLDLLAHYGITPETMGCEIRASMETVQLGAVEESPGLLRPDRLRAGRRRHPGRRGSNRIPISTARSNPA